MHQPFNVLVTSISKKVPLLHALRHAIRSIGINSSIIGADSDAHCIGKYFVDIFWEMPLLSELTPGELIKFCHKHHIRAIIPTRDAELPFFAEHRQLLLQKNICVMVSELHTINACQDKLQFSQILDKKHPTIPTSTDIRDIKAESFVVKERFGAGSRAIGLNLTLSEATAFAQKLQEPIFQPYLHLPEYSVDIYVDLKKSIKGSIVRRRDYVVGGESQITSSLPEPYLEQLCAAVASELNIYGHAIFQVFYKQFHVYLIECNARFGGASTLSQAMGLNSFEWFLLEALQQPLPEFQRSSTEKKQIRYPADLLIEVGE